MGNIQNYKIGVEFDGNASKLESEAKKADKSIAGIGKSVGSAADSFGLIPASASNAIGSADELTESIIGVGASAGPAGAAVIVSTGAMVLGFTAVVSVTSSLTRSMFELSKQTSEYGVEIANFNKLTGFSVETIQSLKMAAEGTGGSLDELEEVFESFVELMNEAAAGAEDAKEKVKSLGLDPVTANQDLEASFLKVLDKIREMPTQSSKAKVAIDGMGESGLNMVKVADAMTGGTRTYIEEQIRAGRVMDAEGIQKSKEFSRALGELEAQASAAKNEFALQFMPVFTDAMRTVNVFFQENRSEIKFWGQVFGSTLESAINYTRLFTRGMNSLAAMSSALSRGDFATAKILFDVDVAQTKAFWQEIENRKNTRSLEMGIGALPPPPKTNGGKSKSSKPSASTNTVEQDMRKTFEEMGFTVVRTFGKAINKGSLHPVGKAIDLRVHGKTTEELFKAAIVGINKGWQLVDERVPRIGKNGKPIKQTGPHFHFEEDSGTDPSLFLDAQYYGGQKQLEYLKQLDKERIEKTTIGAFNKKQNDEIKKQNDFIDRYIDSFQNLGDVTQRVALERNKDFQKLSDTQKEELRLLADEWDARDQAVKVGEDFNRYVDNLSKSYDTLTGVEETASAELARWIETIKDAGVVLADGDLERLTYKAQVIDTTVAQKKFNEELEKTISKNKELTRGRYAEGTRPRIVGGQPIVDATPRDSFSDVLKDGLFGVSGIQKAQSEADILKNTYSDLANTVVGAFSGMTQAAESTLAGYILTGEAGGAAFAQLTAQIIASLAVQSGVKAIFEMAEGFAALARWDPVSATAHFTSAKIYGAVAVASGAAGIAIGASGGLSGNKNKNSNNDSYGFGDNSYEDNRKLNFLRQSDVGSNQSQATAQLQLTVTELRNSVTGLQNSVNHLTQTNKELESRVRTQPPGVIVADGIKENRGLISETMTSELSSNSTSASKFGKVLGIS